MVTYAFKSMEFRHGEKWTKVLTASVYTGVRQIPRDREKERGRIVCVRIQNRRRCLSLKRRWRDGIPKSRELGNLAPYLR